ncbi:hypothetical protein B0A50_04727 [Salinomyces thailandicus]|uniref:Uncharacterized protein n=1 Tax=Salinomyces thailandicus TaxID=706561 RepID=A0A4V5N4Q1_9PEZI|nr:hypothetical protein B0A50_04727 [Salinomyces thailandica]
MSLNSSRKGDQRKMNDESNSTKNSPGQGTAERALGTAATTQPPTSPSTTPSRIFTEAANTPAADVNEKSNIFDAVVAACNVQLRQSQETIASLLNNMKEEFARLALEVQTSERMDREHLQSLQIDMHQLRIAMRGLEADNENLRAVHKDQRTEIARLREDNNELRADNQQLHRNDKQRRTGIEELKRCIKQLRAHNQQLHRNDEQRRTALEKHRKAIKGLWTAIELLRAGDTQLEKLLPALEQLNTNEEQRRADIEEHHDPVQDLWAAYDQLRADGQQLYSNDEQHRTDIEEHHDPVQGLWADYDQPCADDQQLHSNYEQHRTDIEERHDPFRDLWVAFDQPCADDQQLHSNYEQHRTDIEEPIKGLQAAHDQKRETFGSEMRFRHQQHPAKQDFIPGFYKSVDEHTEHATGAVIGKMKRNAPTSNLSATDGPYDQQQRARLRDAMLGSLSAQQSAPAHQSGPHTGRPQALGRYDTPTSLPAPQQPPKMSAKPSAPSQPIYQQAARQQSQWRPQAQAPPQSLAQPARQQSVDQPMLSRATSQQPVGPKLPPAVENALLQVPYERAMAIRQQSKAMSLLQFMEEPDAIEFLGSADNQIALITEPDHVWSIVIEGMNA